MKIIDENTVVVANYLELKDGLENNSSYNPIYLENNIAHEICIRNC